MNVKEKIHLFECEKKHIWIYLFESLLIAVFGVFSLHTHFEGLMKTNYINDFGVVSVFFFILFFIIAFILIPVIYKVIDRCLEILSFKSETASVTEGSFKEIILWLVLGVLFFVPFFLTFYPGGIWADTFTSIFAAKENILTNRHPLLYNLGIAAVVKICGLFHMDMTNTCAMLTLVQFVMMMCVFAYFVHWMIRKGVPQYLRSIISFVLFLSPISALYGISVWKDTPYSLAMMLWMMWSYDLYRSVNDGFSEVPGADGKSGSGTLSISKSVWIRFLAGAFLAAFLRNNGKYIVALTLIAWIVLLLKRKAAVKYLTVLATFVICVFVIQGPFYDIIGVKETDTVEKYAIPLQQICAVVAEDGKISDEELSVLSGFVSPDDIRENFDPINADNIKWVGSFNDDHLKDQQFLFLRLWGGLALKNPGICLQEYLLSTCGFWDVTSNPNTAYAYVQTYVWENFYNVISSDKWEGLFGFSIKNKLAPKHFINGAALVWIFIILTFYVWTRFGIKATLISVPGLLMWLTIMLATPIAVSFRYVAPLLFSLPVWIVVLIMMHNK